MNDILLSAGAACVILAVVGGGATAFGVQIPVLNSIRRQVALGVVGVGFLAAAFVVGNRSAGTTQGNQAVAAYQQEVLAACRTVQSGASGSSFLAAVNNDGTFDRGRVITAIRARIAANNSVWQELWQHPVPNELQAKASAARQAANDDITQYRAAVDKIPAEVPATFTEEQFLALAGQFNAAVQAPDSRLDGAMSELAGQPCGVPAPAPTG